MRWTVVAVVAVVFVLLVALPSTPSKGPSPKVAPMSRGGWAAFAGDAIEDFPADCLLGSGRTDAAFDEALTEAGYDRSSFDAAAKAARRLHGRPARAAIEGDLAAFIRPLGDGRLPEAPEAPDPSESFDPVDELVIELSMRLRQRPSSGEKHDDR